MRHAPFSLNRSRRVVVRGSAMFALVFLAPVVLPAHPSVVAAATTRVPALPDRLSDGDFWKLVTDISEPGGVFRIVDNFTSNEREIGALFTQLRDRKIS